MGYQCDTILRYSTVQEGFLFTFTREKVKVGHDALLGTDEHLLPHVAPLLTLPPETDGTTPYTHIKLEQIRYLS